MGYAVYERNGRDCGYGVPSKCDQPGCEADINRGIDYCCGELPGGGEHGCGLYFCYKHLYSTKRGTICVRCRRWEKPYNPKPDTPEWLQWKLEDESWGQWRDENPEEVERIRELVSA